MFEGILGQENAKKKLEAVVKTKRTTNAYIFSGPDGVGKKMIAKKFAEKLIGITVDNSTDFTIIEPKKGASSIKIEQIRFLNGDINIKPYSDYKIYLIDNAEKMTTQAQNALLKTLEEPSSYGIIILITKNEQALLQTIRSRCTEVKFSPLTRNQVKEILLSKNVGEETANTASIFSRGSASLAMDISKGNELINLRTEVEKYIEYMIIEKNKFEVSMMKDKLIEYKSKIDKILELLKIYIRDAIIYRECADESLLINIDRRKIIRKIALKTTVAQLGRIMDEIEATDEKIASNCNFNTTVQTMALNIYYIASGKDFDVK